jgi:hypothetical protein
MLFKLKANNLNKDSTIIIEKQNNSSSLENIFSINNNSTAIKKNLILGTIIDYNWKTISPFFISFKKAGFNNCDCVMFVYKLQQETINKIKSFDVRVIHIQTLRNTRRNNIRHKFYEDFLRNNFDKYNLVLTIDVRDSIFQKDIFKYYENNKSILVLAHEDNNLSSPVNKKWFIDAFGKNIHKTIENERIICA